MTLPPFAPPDYQGDLFAVDGTRLYRVTPWWLGHPRPPAPSPAVTPEEVAPVVTSLLLGGWTSAFGYISAANWPS
jgi:hypothetical protein